MLHAPSRASTSSSSSFVPVSRQNTMSSHDGSRSVRQSKRYSVTALYLSMSAKDKELEIEDDLARGMRRRVRNAPSRLIVGSSEDTPRTQGQDLVAVQEELRPGKGCALPRLTDSPADSEPHGFGGGALTSLTYHAVLTIAAK